MAATAEASGARDPGAVRARMIRTWNRPPRPSSRTCSASGRIPRCATCSPWRRPTRQPIRSRSGRCFATLMRTCASAGSASWTSRRATGRQPPSGGTSCTTCTWTTTTGSTTGAWSIAPRRTSSAGTCGTSPASRCTTSRARRGRWSDGRRSWRRTTSSASTTSTTRSRIGQVLAHDPDELVQKAVGGWVREAGKQDVDQLRAYLDRNAATMPRTALRYAVEHLDADERRRYLAMKASTGSSPAG